MTCTLGYKVKYWGARPQFGSLGRPRSRPAPPSRFASPAAPVRRRRPVATLAASAPVLKGGAPAPFPSPCRLLQAFRGSAGAAIARKYRCRRRLELPRSQRAPTPELPTTTSKPPSSSSRSPRLPFPFQALKRPPLHLRLTQHVGGSGVERACLPVSDTEPHISCPAVPRKPLPAPSFRAGCRLASRDAERLRAASSETPFAAAANRRSLPQRLQESSSSSASQTASLPSWLASSATQTGRRTPLANLRSLKVEGLWGGSPGAFVACATRRGDRDAFHPVARQAASIAE